jgi:hypothetical protein
MRDFCFFICSVVSKRDFIVRKRCLIHSSWDEIDFEGTL